MLPPCARLVRIMSPTLLPRRYARRPRHTLRSHDCQRTSRKLSVHAAPLNSPFAHNFPHYNAQAAAYVTFERFSTRIKQAQRSQVFKTRPRAKGGRGVRCACGVRYACTMVYAHHVSQARMLPPCAYHAPHCTAQAVRAGARTLPDRIFGAATTPGASFETQ